MGLDTHFLIGMRNNMEKDVKNRKNYIEIKKKQAMDKAKRDHSKYFDYYDDIKSHTNGQEDW